MSHGGVRLWYETAERAMSINERLELFVRDAETLGVAQRRRTCVLAVNQQALEHLYSDS